ncbi:unnamed protein product [Boreogadus saida]
MENTCSQYLFLFLLSLTTSPPLPVAASIDRLRSVWMHQSAVTWHQAKDYLNNGKLVDNYCDKKLYFLCECNLVFVEEKKTWEEALDHCRALGRDASKRIDLFSFYEEEELSYAREVMTWAQTEEVWIGLRWLAGRWLWMDRNAGGVITLPECPANGNHCGTLSGGGQQARNCVEKRRFFCLKQAN